jgi:hypothetical protein
MIPLLLIPMFLLGGFGFASPTYLQTTGDEIFMNVNDTLVNYYGHSLKLLDVPKDNTVELLADGKYAATISGKGKVGAFTVTVKETFYSDTKSERAAVLVVSVTPSGGGGCIKPWGCPIIW